MRMSICSNFHHFLKIPLKYAETVALIDSTNVVSPSVSLSVTESSLWMRGWTMLIIGYFSALIISVAKLKVLRISFTSYATVKSSVDGMSSLTSCFFAFQHIIYVLSHQMMQSHLSLCWDRSNNCCFSTNL